MTELSAFWDDHATDMRNAEYRHHFVLESRRIAVIDAMINRLNELRETEGLSKAQLARAIEKDPAAVRRLLTAKQVNPTFGIVADIAAALGYELVLKPLDAKTRSQVTAPLREHAVS